MKIAQKLIVTASFLTLSLVAAPSALAAPGTGAGGDSSHYPSPSTVHKGVGHGGSNSHHLPPVDGHQGVGHGGNKAPAAATTARKKATGQVTRASYRFDREHRTVRTKLVFESVRATKITVTTVSCTGEVLKKADRATNPAAAGRWIYEYVARTPKGASMSIVKFSQPSKRSTKQVIYASCP